MANLDEWLRPATQFLEEQVLTDTVRIELPPTGEPVLNPTTGNLERPAGHVLYEGPGAVLPDSSAGERSVVVAAAQPWTQQTRSRYVLLTPLSAPIPPENAVALVVAVHDPTRTALLGRTWICTDPGQASTVEVVRRTTLDQNQTTPEAS